MYIPKVHRPIELLPSNYGRKRRICGASEALHVTKTSRRKGAERREGHGREGSKTLRLSDEVSGLDGISGGGLLGFGDVGTSIFPVVDALASPRGLGGKSGNNLSNALDHIYSQTRDCTPWWQ